jgi:pimeloyl-ACP methyl ester carboxylesterase
VPNVFSKRPHEPPALLFHGFHDPELGEQMMTADGDLDDPKFLEAFVIRNTRQLAMAGKLLLPISDRGLDERLCRICGKSVIIQGEDGGMITPAHGDAFRRGIANAEAISIPAAGRMVFIERPEAVASAMTQRDWRQCRERA